VENGPLFLSVIYQYKPITYFDTTRCHCEPEGRAYTPKWLSPRLTESHVSARRRGNLVFHGIAELVPSKVRNL
jgi:hypothetical protein